MSPASALRSTAAGPALATRLTQQMSDGAEQPVGQTVSFAEGSAEQPVGITVSLPEQCVATPQVSAGQPFRLSQNIAAQPNQPCDLALFIHYFPKHALAQGSLALVCIHKLGR